MLPPRQQARWLGTAVAEPAPVAQHQLGELELRGAAHGARDDLQGPIDAPRGLLRAVREAAACDVAEGRHQVLPADFGHLEDLAVVLDRRELLAGGLADLVEGTVGGHQGRHLRGQVPEDVQRGPDVVPEVLGPGLAGAGERLAREQAVPSVDAPEVLRGQGHHGQVPHGQQLGGLRQRPAVVLALLVEARLLRVGDVLLEEVEGRAPRANGVGDVPGLHDEVLHVLPVLPAEVEHARNAPVEGPLQGLRVAGVGRRLGEPDDAVADRLLGAERREEVAVLLRHGFLEEHEGVAEPLRRDRDAERRVHAGEQGAHRPRRPGELLLRRLARAVEDQLPRLDERPQDLVEDVLGALRGSVFGALVHDRQAGPHHAPERFLERDEVVEELLLAVGEAHADDGRHRVRGLRLDHDVRLEEPLLVQETREAVDAADVARRDRAVGVDPRPVVQDRAAVVNHGRPLQLPAQQQHGLGQERGQLVRCLHGGAAGAAAAKLRGAALHTGAELQGAAPPVRDHRVPHHAEGALHLLLGEVLDRRVVAAGDHARLNRQVAVQVAPQGAGDPQRRQQVRHLDEDLPGGPVQRLDVDRVARREEAVGIYVPDLLGGLQLAEGAGGGAACEDRPALRMRAARQLHPGVDRLLLDGPGVVRVDAADEELLHLALRDYRVAHGLERLRGVAAAEREQKQESSRVLLGPLRDVVDVVVDDDPEVAGLALLGHLGPADQLAPADRCLLVLVVAL
mmetsp:Transcript_71425/g.209710  ORF Transcript_71425/g.209710 Transcript_71425/m.209710 type:complete len:737 (-) Transcript_71425:247-2457(-)